MWECRKCHERLEDRFEACWNCGALRGGVVDEGGQASAPDAPSTTAIQHSARSGGTNSARTMSQLIFIGLNGYALALDRDTGEIVWSNNQMRSGYVSLLLDGDRLIVSTNGYMYCLDPLTGRILWHNPLTGYGLGAPTSLASVRGQSSPSLIEQAAEDVARASSSSS